MPKPQYLLPEEIKEKRRKKSLMANPNNEPMPEDICNLDNFKKLIKVVDVMDHELINMGNDITEYFERGFNNMKPEDMEICSCLLEQYKILEEADAISREFSKAIKNEKEVII